MTRWLYPQTTFSTRDRYYFYGYCFCVKGSVINPWGTKCIYGDWSMETQGELRTMMDSLVYTIYSETQSNVLVAIKMGTSLMNVLSKTVIHLLRKFIEQTTACNGKGN